MGAVVTSQSLKTVVTGSAREYAVLNALGVSRSALGRVVVEQAFPLELKVPNAETRAAMAESRAMMSARQARFANAPALFDALEKNSSQ